MTAETVEEKSHREVACMFCGTMTEVPAPKAARHASGKGRDANYRVSIVRCRLCGKEAPYQLSGPDEREVRVRSASAAIRLG